MWFVYIIKCSDNTLYAGITNNLERRIKKHDNKLGAKYTKARTPVKLVYKEKYLTRADALRREFQIKKLQKEEKMALIKK